MSIRVGEELDVTGVGLASVACTLTTPTGRRHLWTAPEFDEHGPAFWIVAGLVVGIAGAYCVLTGIHRLVSHADRTARERWDAQAAEDRKKRQSGTV